MGEGMARTGEDAEMGQEVKWGLWDVLAGAKAMASPNLTRHPNFFGWNMLVSCQDAATQMFIFPSWSSLT